MRAGCEQAMLLLYWLNRDAHRPSDWNGDPVTNAKATNITWHEGHVSRAEREAFLEQTGRSPHVIISHLAPTKLDANREIVEAALGDPFATFENIESYNRSVLKTR